MKEGINMLIQTLCDLFFNIINKIVFVFNIPQIDDIEEYTGKFFGLIENGLGLFFYFYDYKVIKIFITILIVMISFKLLYLVIMWILKKIPLVGVS